MLQPHLYPQLPAQTAEKAENHNKEVAFNATAGISGFATKNGKNGKTKGKNDLPETFHVLIILTMGV